MEFVFDKLDSTECTQCGGLVDVADQPAFRSVTCPNCQARMPVPGKLGALLLQEEIGSGAAGIVYKALDSTLHRHVAVKILKNEEGESSRKIVEATVAEARALAAINHPNVVHIHTIGMRHGQPFIVMELLIGSGKLNVMLKEGWTADELRALEIGIDVAQGLRAAQGAGLLHRDVKPGNILFNSEGVAKLLDFSVVHAATGDGEKVVIGTPYYIAPEAARGLEVDFRADLYSLGATLFHLIAGRPVFEGETSRDVMRARLKQKAPDIRTFKPAISGMTAAVLAKMLATEPAERHGSYDELIDELKAALVAFTTGKSEPAISSELAELHDALSGGGPQTAAIPVASSKRRREAPAAAPVKKGISPAMIGIAAAAGLALIIGLVVMLSGGGSDKQGTQLAGDIDPRRQRVDTPTENPAGNTDGDTGKTTPDKTDANKDAGAKVDEPPKPPAPDPEPEPKQPEPKQPEPKQPEPVKPQPAPQPAPEVAFDQMYKAWSARIAAQLKAQPTKWEVIKPNSFGSMNNVVTYTPQPDGSVLVGGKSEAAEVLAMETFAPPVKLSQITAIRIEALPDDSLPGKGPGRGPNGNFVLSHLTMLVRRKDEPNPQPTQSNSFFFRLADADFAQQGFPPNHAADNDPQTGWATSPRLGQANSAMYIIGHMPEQAKEDDMVLRVQLHHQSQHAQHVIGRFRISITSDPQPMLPLDLPANIESILKAAKRDTNQEKELQTYFRRVKLEGLTYTPPGAAVAGGGDTKTPATTQTPAPTGPPAPKLDAYEPVELAKLRDQKSYDADDDALVLIPRNSAWHYWASPEAPAADWAAANFTASGWKADDAPFGYAYADLRTTLKEMKGGYASLYVRAPFKVIDPAKLESLLLQGRFDDGVIVYLNGALVHRSSNVNGAGHSAKVTSPQPRVTMDSIELKDIKKHLKAGVNVLAIECHNASENDLDFVVDPALIAIPMPPPRKAASGNKVSNWTGKQGKLFTDDKGLIVDGEDKPGVIETGSTKIDFEDRSYGIRVVVRLRTSAVGQMKLDARSRPKGAKSDTTDTDSQPAPGRAMREVVFDVKVTGKLNALTLQMPPGESTIDSIKVLNKRDNKVLEQWDFTK